MTVDDSQAFDTKPSSAADIVSRLTIGAMNPASYGAGVYSSRVVNDFVVHEKNGFNKDTIVHFIGRFCGFCFHLEGRKMRKRWCQIHALKNLGGFDPRLFEINDTKKSRNLYFMNVESTVNIDTYSFRNPPHFMSMVPSETNLRDAQYETGRTPTFTMIPQPLSFRSV